MEVTNSPEARFNVFASPPEPPCEAVAVAPVDLYLTVKETASTRLPPRTVREVRIGTSPDKTPATSLKGSP